MQTSASLACRRWPWWPVEAVGVPFLMAIPLSSYLSSNQSLLVWLAVFAALLAVWFVVRTNPRVMHSFELHSLLLLLQLAGLLLWLSWPFDWSFVCTDSCVVQLLAHQSWWKDNLCQASSTAGGRPSSDQTPKDRTWDSLVPASRKNTRHYCLSAYAPNHKNEWHKWSGSVGLCQLGLLACWIFDDSYLLNDGESRNLRL